MLEMIKQLITFDWICFKVQFFQNEFSRDLLTGFYIKYKKMIKNWHN